MTRHYDAVIIGGGHNGLVCAFYLARAGCAVGVKLVSGEEIAADIVATNVGPALLFRQLIDSPDLSPTFTRRMAGYRTGSGTFRMNVALSELPDFSKERSLLGRLFRR